MLLEARHFSWLEKFQRPPFWAMIAFKTAFSKKDSGLNFFYTTKSNSQYLYKNIIGIIGFTQRFSGGLFRTLILWNSGSKFISILSTFPILSLVEAGILTIQEFILNALNFLLE